MKAIKQLLDSWKAQRRYRSLPKIWLTNITSNYHFSFTSPAPDYKAQIRNTQKNVVGTLSYAVSPLHDRIYIFNIVVNQSYQRQGYATAVLFYLANEFSLPITATQEISSGRLFWKTARTLSSAGLVVTEPISVSEFDEEKARWGHLEDESKKVQAEIVNRLVNGESYEQATSRGLAQS